jgi:hypothetical protein
MIGADTVFVTYRNVRTLLVQLRRSDAWLRDLDDCTGTRAVRFATFSRGMGASIVGGFRRTSTGQQRNMTVRELQRTVGGVRCGAFLLSPS